MTGTTVGQMVQPGDEVRLNINGASALTGPAKDAFHDVVKSYATELLEEASRQELGHRARSSPVPQYTTRHIAKAEDVLRDKDKVFVPRHRSRWFIVAKVAIYLIAAVIGVSGNQMSQPASWILPSTAWLVLFFVALTIGLCLAIVTEFIDNKERG